MLIFPFISSPHTDSPDMDRQAEIEAKKAKIAELRKRRKETLAPGSTTRQIPVPQESIHKLVDSLIETRINSETKRESSLESENIEKTREKPVEKTKQWSSIVVPVFDVPTNTKKEIITYSKNIQTSEEWMPESHRHGEKSRESERIGAEENLDVEERYDSMDEHELLDEQEQFDLKLSQLDEQVTIKEETGESKDEPENLSIHDSFHRSFFDDSDTEDLDTSQDSFQLAQLWCEESSDRAITSIDWSYKYSELVAVSYTEKPNASDSPKGLILIWNLRRTDRKPEFILTAPTDILSIKFSPFNAKILFGSGYNGQIFSWNLRTGSKPVLATPLTGNGHKHPVYSFDITGTQNSSTIFSVSTDGTLCTWSPDMLANPLEKISLMASAVTETSPTCLAISPKDPTMIFIGTEESTIYQCNRFSNAETKAGVDPRGAYQGHRGPISTVQTHSIRGAVNLSDYLLSAGFDWSIRIWKLTQFTGSSSLTTHKTIIKPLHTIQKDDVIYDISWNPNFPNIFGSVDGTGHLEIWDVINDLDAPIARIRPSPPEINESDPDIRLTDSTASYLNRPLNKLCWDKAAESRRVAVGGLDGILMILEINPKLLPDAKPDDWMRTKKSLARLEESG